MLMERQGMGTTGFRKTSDQILIAGFQIEQPDIQPIVTQGLERLRQVIQGISTAHVEGQGNLTLAPRHQLL
jgi:hypothetical protein